MKCNFHAVVNNTWYSILFDHKVTKLFSIEIFSGAGHAGKILIIIIILFLIIIIIIIIIVVVNVRYKQSTANTDSDFIQLIESMIHPTFVRSTLINSQ